MPTNQGGGRVEFTVSEAVPERGTFAYTVSLFGDTGAALPASAVSTITATLVAALSGTAIFTARNVKNLNGGTLVDGAFSLVVAGVDLALQSDEITDTYAERRLTLTIEATGTGGAALPIPRELVFFVRNLREVV